MLIPWNFHGDEKLASSWVILAPQETTSCSCFQAPTIIIFSSGWYCDTNIIIEGTSEYSDYSGNIFKFFFFKKKKSILKYILKNIVKVV